MTQRSTMASLAPLSLLALVSSVRVYRPWTVKHWCDSVTEPHWPFAYSKYQNQLLEFKGRVNSNIQDMRHKCSIGGVQSKCHVCENIKCGAYEIQQQPNTTQMFTFKAKTNIFEGLVSESNFVNTCSMQLQGVEWKDLSKNIPTVSDTAWAVGANVRHRYDFSKAERMCVMMSGGYCISPYASDYSECTVRCWGADSLDILRRNHTGKIDATQLPRNNPHSKLGLVKWPLAGDYGATDSWERDRATPVDGIKTAQGRVGTLAGDGKAGDVDGPSATARFNSPHDVAVDKDRNVYVADTKNNKIRMISPQGVVSTFAGTGAVGFADGAVSAATFSAPQGVTVYYDWRDSFRYKGCFKDEPPNRHLPDKLLVDKQMTPSMCWRHCWSYKFFAVQRGTECRCGNALPPTTETVDLHKCDTVCASYAGTPEDPPWGSRAWGNEATPAADNYLPPGKDTFHGGGTNQWLRTDRGKCGGHNINSVYENRQAFGELQIFVADTGNHRIRLIRNGVVSCFAGRCGHGTFSNTLSMTSATPQPGYADGTGDLARFHTPMGIAVDSNGTVFVADTYNYLIRFVNYEGVVHTLAGSTTIAQKTPEGKTQPGCPPPCLKGVVGQKDGDLTSAEFSFPSDVTIGLNSTIVVTDAHRVRSVTYSRYSMVKQSGDPRDNIWLPGIYGADNKQTHVGSGYTDSTIQGVVSQDRVVTLAGETDQGRRDGKGFESSFNRPEGLAMDVEGKIYVSGTVSCRIRRISSAEQTAVNVGCGTIATELIRPSGCASYNPPVDALDFTTTPAVGETYHRYDERLDTGTLHKYDLYGRRIYNCQGTPPVDALEKGDQVVDMHNGDLYEKSQFPENYQLVWDKDLTGKQWSITDIKEDTNDGTTIKVMCPSGCSAGAANNEKPGEQAYGTDFYADYSSVCLAAIHAGAIEASMGGLISLTLHRGKVSRAANVQTGSTRYGITTLAADGELPRVFSTAAYPLATMEVQTVAGHPSAIQENACGFKDATPAQEARFSKPAGLAMFVNVTLTQSEQLYIADTGNHRIRTMTAVCSQICENGGYCTHADECTCPAGWTGKDCTLAVCTRGAGAVGLCGKPRTVCVGPDTCACLPGYTGANCKQTLCVQSCQNGGTCAAPDTCECLPGWFDSNCTTPVCSQTCAHGGNCTAPNICTCPADWTGVDCRVPVCEQAEWNGHDGKLMRQSPGVNTPDFTERLGVHPQYKCRNGGYCTAPNTCTCPPQWSGHDCGLPVCSQGFMVPDDPKDKSYNQRSYDMNHPDYKSMLVGYLGYSTAPCSSGKNGNGRCKKQTQIMTWYQPKNSPLENGTFVERPRKWMQYTPCHLDNWVAATNTFDFRQQNRKAMPRVVEGGGKWRNRNGWNNTPPACMMMELGEDALSQYQYLDEFNKTSPYAIYTPKAPYGPDAVGHPWKAWTSKTKGHTGPWTYVRDRQVALVQLQEIQQGPYVCANGGSCVAPDICMCAPGWIGFDCRTPVCEQGYFEPEQLEFTAKDSTSIRGNVPHVKTHERQPDSNPAYVMEDHNLTYTDLLKSKRVYGDIRYLTTSRSYGGGPGGANRGIKQKWSGQTGLHEILERLDMKYYRANIINPDINSYRYQGGYSCSLRALTHWESPSETLGPGTEGSLYGRDTDHTDNCHPSNTSCGRKWGKSRLFEHPNYYSRYMNTDEQEDGLTYTHWEGMEWQPTYRKTVPLLDNTREGHMRDGLWLPTGMIWEKGVCLMEFDRTCPNAPWKERDLYENGRMHSLVVDTDASYRARLEYSYDKVRGPDGRWDRKGGECVDEVIRGCYNNGTCVAPNTCRCAPGWTGYDCSVPECEQECMHNSNCTLPNICTCERGWTGHSCEIPMCAQDCNNGGVCIAPDVCHCRTWPTRFYDHRFGGGRPLFRKPDGAPQSTGWTGYDCNTPICVQHEFFRLNYRTGSGNAQKGYDCSSHPHKEDCGWQTLFGRAREDVGFTDMTPIELPSHYMQRPAPPWEIDLGGGEVQALESLSPSPGRLVFLETEPLPGTCYEMKKVPDSDPPLYITRWDDEKDRFFLQSERSCPRQPWEGGTCAQKDRCQEYDQTVTENDGTYFQSGCALNDPRPRFNTVSNESRMTQILRLRDYQDKYNENRTSNDYLCMVLKWYQGDYIDDGNSGMLQHGWHKLADSTVAARSKAKKEGKGDTGDIIRVSYFGQATTKCRETGQWQGGKPWEEDSTWQGTAGCELQTFTKGILPQTTGRKVRRNHHRYAKMPGTVSKWGDEEWMEVEEGDNRRGEGVYACYNRGSCIYPDRCSCADGWTGFDCQTPLCRHKQMDPFLGHNNIASCLNGGLCSNKDNCTCIKTASVLHKQFEDVPVGFTGFEGTDCSIAVCVQGFFDVDCVGVAPGGQGCYRCNNGGNCTAPDHCTCAEGWTGYDCMTPVCTQVANERTRIDLYTVDEDRIHQFEMDPCGEDGGRWGKELVWGLVLGQGNCTLPNVCTCLCKDYYHKNKCKKYGSHCKKSWRDPLGRSIPSGYTFGGFVRNYMTYESDAIPAGEGESSRACADGYEGNVDSNLRFTSCHLKIYVPEWWERDSIILIAVSGVLFFLGSVGYVVLRRKLKQRFLLAKAERRRSRKSSENADNAGAFGHK